MERTHTSGPPSPRFKGVLSMWKYAMSLMARERVLTATRNGQGLGSTICHGWRGIGRLGIILMYGPSARKYWARFVIGLRYTM